MIAVYVIVCVVLFIVSIVFVILYFRRSMLKDEGYLTTFEEFGHIMIGGIVVYIVMFAAFVAVSIYILDKKLNLE